MQMRAREADGQREEARCGRWRWPPGCSRCSSQSGARGARCTRMSPCVRPSWGGAVPSRSTWTPWQPDQQQGEGSTRGRCGRWRRPQHRVGLDARERVDRRAPPLRLAHDLGVAPLLDAEQGGAKMANRYHNDCREREGGGDLAQVPVQDVALDIHQETPRECRGRRGLAGGGVKPRHAAAT